MLQFIMDQNLLLYLCGAACTLGVVSQFLLRHLYGRLIGEIQYSGQAQGKFLRQLCQRFQNCAHLNETVNDVDAFADRSIMDYRFWKMNLHQWRRLGGEALAVCLLCCAAGLWLLYRNGGEISLQTSYSRAAIYSSLLILLTYGMADSGYLHRSLRTRIRDFLQNTGAVKNYSGEGFPADGQDAMQVAAAETASASNTGIGFRFGRKRKASAETRAQRDKRELRENLLSAREAAAETAAAREDPAEREKNRKLLQMMDSKEKEQILKEVLLEFLA